MYCTFGQLPDQPGFHCTKKEISFFCFFSCFRNIIKKPFYFCAGKISINHKPCFFSEFACKTFFFQTVTVFGSSAALPYDSMINGFSCIFVPYNGSLTLVGDADGSYIRCSNTNHIHGLYCYPQHTGPNFICIVFYPSWLWKILVKFPLCHAAHSTFLIKQNATVAGSPRIQCHYIFFAHISSLLKMYY